MARKPKYTVQTIPELRSSGMVVMPGQAGRLVDSELLLYTALARGSDGWYTITGGPDPLSEVDAIAGGLGRMPLGYGYGIWHTRPGCYMVTHEMHILDYANLAKVATLPCVGDSVLPIVLKDDSKGTISLFDVAEKRVRTFSEVDVPFIVDIEAASKWAGSGSADRYMKDMGKIPKSLYVATGLRAPVTGTVAASCNLLPTLGARHTLYTCGYGGKEFSNKLTEANWYQLLEY